MTRRSVLGFILGAAVIPNVSTAETVSQEQETAQNPDLTIVEHRFYHRGKCYALGVRLDGAEQSRDYKRNLYREIKRSEDETLLMLGVFDEDQRKAIR